MELLQPLGWLALLGAPVIVALYFLRKRRPPRVVGSLLLWSQARRDALRGRPWDRFRPSALLWIQLLVLLGLALAALRPACVTEQTQHQRLVLVLDGSASMAAHDVEPSRWGAALERARQTLEAAPPDTEAAILMAGRLTRVVAPLTRDRSALRRALDRLERRGPDHTRGHMQQALLLASQLGGADGDRQIILFSDGNFDHSQVPQTLANGASYVQVGQRADNLAITTLEVRRALESRFGAWLLCTVTNTGPTPLEGLLELDADGDTVETARLSLEPGQSRSVSVPLERDEAVLRARLLDITGPDQAQDWLKVDNEATAVLAPEEPLRVRLISANPLLERALRLNPRVALEVAALEDPPASPPAEVTLYDQVFPAQIPQGRFLALAPPPENPLLRWGEALSAPQVATWDQGHPVLHHVELGHVRFSQVQRAQPTAPMVPLAEFSGDGGPLLLAGQTPSWKGLVWTAPLLQSDLPLRASFPVWLFNALGWLQPGGEQALGHNTHTGAPLILPAPPGSQVTVSPPEGDAVEVALGAQEGDGAYTFAQTDRAGLYQASVTHQGHRRTLRYGVSLLDEQESSIAPAKALQLPRGQAIAGQEAVVQVQERAWLALWAVLLLALLEWALYLWRARRGGQA